MKNYAAGQTDRRPWGHYEVRDFLSKNGVEYCEKLITVEPGQILSLQSHDLRDEYWRIETGSLTAIRGRRRYHLVKDEALYIPRGTIHTMANLSNAKLVVYERQKGICREDDINRYYDIYGRGTATNGPPELLSSITLYKTILGDVRGIAKSTE